MEQSRKVIVYKTFFAHLLTALPAQKQRNDSHKKAVPENTRFWNSRSLIPARLKTKLLDFHYKIVWLLACHKKLKTCQVKISLQISEELLIYFFKAFRLIYYAEHLKFPHRGKFIRRRKNALRCTRFFRNVKRSCALPLINRKLRKQCAVINERLILI